MLEEADTVSYPFHGGIWRSRATFLRMCAEGDTGFMELHTAVKGAIVTMFFLYFLPGGLLIQRIDVSFLGVPFLVLWAVIIGPVILIILYVVNSRLLIRKEQGAA